MTYLSATKKVSDVEKYVQRQFGDESGVQIQTEDIARWINSGQDEIFRRNEPVKATSTADVVAGQAIYQFPGQILKIQSILVNGIPVERRSYQDAEEWIISNDPNRTETGQPQIWYEWGGDFSLWPTPDTSVIGGITLRYVKAPTNVSVSTDTLAVPDVYYNRLLEYVLSQAYELDENWGAADSKTQQFSVNLDSQAGQDSVSANTYRRITVLDEDM